MCESKQQECKYFDTTIDKNLLGITKIHDGLVVLEGANTVLRKDYVDMTGKVKLISGGRVENELIYTGFVGPGMLTAAIFGNVSSAPSVHDISAVIEEIVSDYSSGILCIIQNDIEYATNFTLAKLHAEAKGYVVKIIVVNTNNILQRHENNIKEQDILPTLFIYTYKIAGAMSEEGRSLDEIYALCHSVVNKGHMVLLKTDFTNVTKKVPKPMTDTLNIILQNQSSESIFENGSFSTGHEVAIIINNFGCNQIQTNVFVLELLKNVKVNGLTVKRVYVKQSMTHPNSTGFHTCLLNLSFSTILIKYLDFPTPAFAWPKMITYETVGFNENDVRRLAASKTCSKNVDCCEVSLQGPLLSYQTSRVLLSIISIACEAVIGCSKQLNKMDQEFGNYGTNLACGAKAIQYAIQKSKILGTNLYITFTQISHILQKTVNGLQGGLYSLFFYNIAKAFSEYENDREMTAEMWLHVLSTTNKSMEQFQSLTMSDQKLLTALVAVQVDFKHALNKNVDPIDAFGAAVKAVETFSTNILYKQPKHICKYPDPQTHAVSVWMRAAYEGAKLNSIICNTK